MCYGSHLNSLNGSNNRCETMPSVEKIGPTSSKSTMFRLPNAFSDGSGLLDDILYVVCKSCC